MKGQNPKVDLAFTHSIQYFMDLPVQGYYLHVGTCSHQRGETN